MSKLPCLFVAIAAAAALPACYSDVEVTTSSASFIPNARSGAEIARPAADTAREITRVLGERGYALLDEKPITPTGTVMLKLTKTRPGAQAVKGDGGPRFAHDVSSVVYAWVTPESEQRSRVVLVAKPTLAGSEPCSVNLPTQLPCTPVRTSSYFRDTYMSGQAEADTVQGALAELRVDGEATGPVPAADVLPGPADPQRDACIAKRAAALTEAEQIPELDARAQALQAVPECAPTR